MSSASHVHVPVATENLAPEASERLARPFHRFAQLSMSGGIVLLLCTIAALLWANSEQFGHAYHTFFHTYFKIEFGDFVLKHSLVHWINDALMAIFFLFVGLEIKRELVVGELSSIKRASLPAFAALGGMVAPAAVYFLLNMGQPTMRGWGVPMATDIAFALGILALLGNRVPTSLRIFLTSLAIVDDLGALLVIAVFYTEQLNWGALGLAGGVVALLVGLNVLRFRGVLWYIIPGIFLWYFFMESGVHATIAGVLLAATIPVTARVNTDSYLDSSRAALDVFDREGVHGKSVQTNSAQRAAVMAVQENGKHALPLLHRMEHAINPWAAFLIVPVFALANAGVEIHGGLSALSGPITLGIIAGLFVGKPLGIMLSCWIACKLGLAALPKGVSWRHIAGAGCLGGIGFTMALFIATLAFPEQADLDHAKVGILAASALSAIVGLGILLSCPKAPEPEPEITGPKIEKH